MKNKVKSGQHMSLPSRSVCLLAPTPIPADCRLQLTSAHAVGDALRWPALNHLQPAWLNPTSTPGILLLAQRTVTHKTKRTDLRGKCGRSTNLTTDGSEVDDLYVE